MHCTIPTEGAPSLRFLQKWAAMLLAQQPRRYVFESNAGNCNLSAPMQSNLAQFLFRHSPLGIQSWTMVVAGSDE